MPPRSRKSWDSFKPAGGRFEERPRPTTGQKIYTAVATLFLGLIFGTVAGVILVLCVIGFGGSRLIGFFHFGHLPGWFYLVVFVTAIAWVIWNWYQGLKEEAASRERIDHHRSESRVPWKARPPENEEDEEPDPRD